MNKYPSPTRVGLIMHSADIAALDRLAARAEVSRANYCRRVLRAHLRQITMPSQVETTPCSLA